MVMRYAHANTENYREGINALPSFREKSGGTVSVVLWQSAELHKPDVQFSRIRLSDWLHHKAHDGDTLRTRFSCSTPRSP
jgi:hypothetical protein